MSPELMLLLLLAKLLLAIATAKDPAHRAWLCRIVAAFAVGAVCGLCAFGMSITLGVALVVIIGVEPVLWLIVLSTWAGFAAGTVWRLVYHYNAARQPTLTGRFARDCPPRSRPAVNSRDTSFHRFFNRS